MVELFAKELIKPIVSSIVKYIQDDTKAQIYAENMQRLLQSNYESRSSIKNILHSTSPVPFKEIFCPLKLRTMTTGFEQDYGAQKIDSIKSLMSTFNNIAIFGNAGCGKSTLVNFLYLNAIDECYKYPILISLRYLNETNDTLVKCMRQQTLGIKELDRSEELFANLMEEGQFLFFFDGYDEITPSKQYSIAVQIKDLVSQYPQNKYVLTSRPLEQLFTLNTFHNFVVSPLTDADRNLFIRKQFPEDRQHIAETIIKKIADNKNNQYDQILNTPLLIILCILNFQLNSDLPIKRTDFYGRIFDALFQGHDWRSKTGYERERKCNMSKDEYIEILSRFSFYTHFKSMYSFKKSEALAVLNRILKSSGDSEAKKMAAAENMFEDLSIAINILINDGGHYCFPHKSFQEYYAANLVYQNREEDRQKIYDKFVVKFFDQNGALLTLSLLSMLYEMDQALFVTRFIIPALNKAKLSITNKVYDLSIKKVERLLAITNVLFFGQDDNSTRELFAVGRIEHHIVELDKLKAKAEEIVQAINREDDFISEILKEDDQMNSMLL